MKNFKIKTNWLLNLLLICLFTPPHLSLAQVTVPSGTYIWDDLTDLPAGYQTGIIFAANTDVTIENGLTIAMNPNTSIELHPGAKVLTRQGVTFNVNNNTDAWNGFIIKSNSTASQGTSYTAVNTTAGVGYLKLTDNTQILNAVIGVAVGDPNISGFNGGVLQAEDSNFINCKYSVYFYPYQDPVNNDKNLSYFTKCTFEWDRTQNYRTALYDAPITGSCAKSEYFNTLVTLENVQGIYFTANSFKNDKSHRDLWLSGGYIDECKGAGITSINSSFLLIKNGPCAHDPGATTNPDPNCVPCFGEPNFFTGLYTGVELVQNIPSINRHVDIEGSHFINNTNGILVLPSNSTNFSLAQTFKNLYINNCYFESNDLIVKSFSEGGIGHSAARLFQKTSTFIGLYKTNNFQLSNNTFKLYISNAVHGQGMGDCRMACSEKLKHLKTISAINLTHCGGNANSQVVYNNDIEMDYYNVCYTILAGINIQGKSSNIAVDYNNFRINEDFYNNGLLNTNGVINNYKAYDIFFSSHSIQTNEVGEVDDWQDNPCRLGLSNSFSKLEQYNITHKNGTYLGTVISPNYQYHIGFSSYVPDLNIFNWVNQNGIFNYYYNEEYSSITQPVRIENPLPNIIVTPHNNNNNNPCPITLHCGYYPKTQNGSYYEITPSKNTKNNNEDIVSIFPNPAFDKIEISSSNAIQNATIIDVLGRIVATHKYPTSNSIDVHSLKPGLYHLIITTASKTTNHTIVKQ